jgi:hypothetical protein
MTRLAKTHAHRDQKGDLGQITIEAILILAILTGVAIYATKYMRTNQVLASVVEGPWQPVRGMIEDGVWMKAGDSKAQHPNLRKRHGTVKGDQVQ